MEGPGFSQTDTGGQSEQKVLSVSRRREPRRKGGLAALLREGEDVGSDRRARLANRILKEFLGDVEKRESPALFARSEKKRLRTDSDAQTYVANRSESVGL